MYQQSTHSDQSERKHKKTTLSAGNQLVILSFTSLRSLIGLEKSHQSLNQSAANKTKPLNFSRHVGCFEFSSTPRDIFLCSDWHSWFSQFYSVNGSVWTLHTVSMYWKRHKPVIIQALVDLAALIRPLLNTSFNLGLRTKLLAPPVTEITRLGISRFHLSSINFRMSWTSVSCDTRTYYGYKKRRLGITFAYFGKGYRRKSLTHFHTRAIHDCLPLLYHSSLINIRCLNAPPPQGVSLRARHWVNWPVVWTVFFSPGLTIYRKVYPTKKFTSKSFACLWKPVALQLKTSMKPISSPPSLPSLTPVPLTRHHNKYSINHGLQRLTGERLFWLPVPRKSISPYASVCICRVHLSGVHWSPVSSLATFKSCWFLVLPHIHIGFLTWKKRYIE